MIAQTLDLALTTEQGRIGTEVGVSDWLVVDQAMIDQFAETIHDRQWIHVDPDRAATTAFGGTIAHGFLTLSLASHFAYQALPPLTGQTLGVNYGFDKLRFVAPVLAGARVRGRFVLDRVARRSEDILQRSHLLTIELDGSPTPALVAQWITLCRFD